MGRPHLIGSAAISPAGAWSLSANANSLSLNFTPSEIPEPSSYATLAGAFALWRRRRNQLNRT